MGKWEKESSFAGRFSVEILLTLKKKALGLGIKGSELVCDWAGNITYLIKIAFIFLQLINMHLSFYVSFYLHSATASLPLP